MEPLPRALPRKGRGAVTNEVGRYEPEQRFAIDDGWGSSEEPPAPLTTQFTVDSTRTIIARNTSPDIGFDRSINPYRGCEHGCVYCFARPTHAYLGLSPGLDFESRIFVKPEAPKLLAAELAKPSYVCRPIAMGTNTDPYQPAERNYEITRGVLEVLRDHNHPVCIVTKSALIQRDIDILSAMAKKNLASVTMSITTLDRGSRAHARAARRDARAAARDAARPRRCRHPDRRPRRADDPGAERCRARGDSGSRRRRTVRTAPATWCCACRSS